MAHSMVESTTNMLNKWTSLVNSGHLEIDVGREIAATAGEIIAKTSFGMSYQNGQKVFQKLKAMQLILFNSNRFVGVPFSKFLHPKQNLEAKKLGKEIDQLLLSIINDRKESIDDDESPPQDLLGLLLKANNNNNNNENGGGLGKMLTTRELIDECKTFFFAGHDTTALALTWTLLLLALHQDWQTQLRDEIREVIGDKQVDFTSIAGLKKVTYFFITYLKSMQINNFLRN